MAHGAKGITDTMNILHALLRALNEDLDPHHLPELKPWLLLLFLPFKFRQHCMEQLPPLLKGFLRKILA